MKGSEANGGNYVGVIVTAILLLLVFLFLSPFRVIDLSQKVWFPLEYLFLPLAGMLGIIVISQGIKAFYTGSFVSKLCGSLEGLSLGVFFSFFLKNIELVESGSIALPLFLFFVLYSGYRIISYFTKENYILHVVSKSASVFIAGFILRHLLSTVVSGSILSLSSIEDVPITELFPRIVVEFLPVSVMVGGVAISLYLLERSDNDYISLFGKWVKTYTGSIGFLGGILWTYFLMRPYLKSYFGKEMLVVEWGFIGLATVVIGYIVKGSVEEMAETEDFESWKKNVQSISSQGDRDQEKLTGLIEEFVEEGKKEDIITYLIRLAQKRGLSLRFTIDMMRDIINYQEEEIPPLVLRSEAERIKEENKKKRREILENTFNDLRGGKR